MKSNRNRASNLVRKGSLKSKDESQKSRHPGNHTKLWVRLCGEKLFHQEEPNAPVISIVQKIGSNSQSPF